MQVTTMLATSKTVLLPGQIHQVTTILATSKKVLLPSYNHLLTTGTDDPTLVIARAPASEVKGHQYQWLAGGYDLEIGHFNKWLA